MIDVASLGRVTPLDAQMGVYPALTHPPDLTRWLFAPDGCALYAVIDAARLKGFGGEASLAPTPCLSLFAGAAQDALASEAPYLLHLRPDDRTLQHLMTSGPMARDWWDARAVIYLRSAAPFSVLHRHLRRYTKVRDRTGAWLYFRFWDPEHIVPLVRAMQDEPGDLAGFLNPRDGPPIRQIIAPTPHQTLVLSADVPPPAMRQPFIMKDRYRAVFEATVTRQFCDDLAHRLRASAPRQGRALGPADAAALGAAIEQLCTDLRPFGVRRRADIARLAVCLQFYGSYPLYDPRLRGLLHGALKSAPHAPSVGAKRAEDALLAQPLHRKLTSVAGLRETSEALSRLPQATAPLERWLAEVLSPGWGFQDTAMRNDFIRLAHEQQWAGARVNEPQARAHYLMARLYGPFWQADALQPGLAALWQARGDDLADQLIAECNRRIAVLQGGLHG